MSDYADPTRPWASEPPKFERDHTNKGSTHAQPDQFRKRRQPRRDETRSRLDRPDCWRSHRLHPRRVALDVTGHLVPDAGHWVAEENPDY
jgi:hypothetical protein